MENKVSCLYKHAYDVGNVFGAFVFGAFVFIHMFFMVFFNPGYKKEYREAKKCPQYVPEDTCEYCGGVYVIGTCISCPHCGASLPAHSYQPDSQTQAGE